MFFKEQGGQFEKYTPLKSNELIPTMAIFKAVSPPFPRKHPSFWGPYPPGLVFGGVFAELQISWDLRCFMQSASLKGKNSRKGS